MDSDFSEESFPQPSWSWYPPEVRWKSSWKNCHLTKLEKSQKRNFQICFYPPWINYMQISSNNSGWWVHFLGEAITTTKRAISANPCRLPFLNFGCLCVLSVLVKFVGKKIWYLGLSELSRHPSTPAPSPFFLQYPKFLVRACACAIGVFQTRWYHYNHWLFLFLSSFYRHSTRHTLHLHFNPD